MPVPPVISSRAGTGSQMSVATQILVAALLAIAAPAQAQMVAATDPASVVRALQDLGYRAVLGTDGRGDPKIDTAIEGVDYTVSFYGCRENAACTVINLSAGFDLPDGIDLAPLNEWNRTKIIGRAYVDAERDPYLDHPVVLADGVPQQAFAETMRRWGWAVAQFKEHIGY